MINQEKNSKRVLEIIVAGTFSYSVVAKIKIMWAGGSSSVLSNALKA